MIFGHSLGGNEGSKKGKTAYAFLFLSPGHSKAVLKNINAQKETFCNISVLKLSCCRNCGLFFLDGDETWPCLCSKSSSGEHNLFRFT